MSLLGPQWSRSSRGLAAARGYIEGLHANPPVDEGYTEQRNPMALRYSTPYPGASSADERLIHESSQNEIRQVPTRSLGSRQPLIHPDHVERHFENMVAGSQVSRRSNRYVEAHTQDPLRVTEYNGAGLEVADGNHRLLAAKLAGIPTVAVNVAMKYRTEPR